MKELPEEIKPSMAYKMMGGRSEFEYICRQPALTENGLSEGIHYQGVLLRKLPRMSITAGSKEGNLPFYRMHLMASHTYPSSLIVLYGVFAQCSMKRPYPF
jgi:hypothetical protein